MGLGRRARPLLALVVVLVGVFGASTPAHAQAGSPLTDPPPQANDDCRASQDATPVVLVHGTFFNRSQFFRFSPALEAEGYCVFALNYGCLDPSPSCGRGPIERSARELRDFIDEEVLPQSRSGKVSIVGHSQGGLMPRYYLKFLGGRSKVEDMIGLSGSNHGTDNPLAPFAINCPACLQQFPYRGSFTARINRGDETLGTIDYTQIQTRFDEVAIPYFSAYLADDPDVEYNGPRTRLLNGPRSANVCLQDRYPLNADDHLTITFSEQALAVVVEALDRDGTARVVRPDSVCARLGGDPGGGGPGSGGGGEPAERPACTIEGTSGNDVLRGTARDDVICARGGNDVVRGGEGDDTIYGGEGNDTVRGDNGADDLFGEAGTDAVNANDGTRGNDTVNGGAGQDACNADFGDTQANCP